MATHMYAKCVHCEKEFKGGIDADSALVDYEDCKSNAWWKLNYHMEQNHKDQMMQCPRRSEGGMMITKYDYWDDAGTCSYCGSMSAKRFFEAVEAGENIDPTDKSYKVYVGDKYSKFYFQHLDEEDKKKFIELYNNKTMKMKYNFYVRPYFCAAVGK